MMTTTGVGLGVASTLSMADNFYKKYGTVRDPRKALADFLAANKVTDVEKINEIKSRLCRTYNMSHFQGIS